MALRPGVGDGYRVSCSWRASSTGTDYTVTVEADLPPEATAPDVAEAEAECRRRADLIAESLRDSFRLPG